MMLTIIKMMAVMAIMMAIALMMTIMVAKKTTTIMIAGPERNETLMRAPVGNLSGRSGRDHGLAKTVWCSSTPHRTPEALVCGKTCA